MGQPLLDEMVDSGVDVLGGAGPVVPGDLGAELVAVPGGAPVVGEEEGVAPGGQEVSVGPVGCRGGGEKTVLEDGRRAPVNLGDEGVAS